MPERYSSGRDPRRDGERPVRSAARPGSASRPAARPQQGRPAQGHPAQGRPAGSRAPQGRRPAPRRRKKRIQPRFFILIGVVFIALVVALILLLGGKGSDPGVQPLPTPQPVANTGMSNATISSAEPASQAEDSANVQDNQGGESLSSLPELLGDNDSELAALSEDERVKVSNLSVNASLPDTWTNFLLLGTDERLPNESARTDTMIICSISKKGEVKLTSIMRDLAVKMDNLGKYSGTRRINNANYFGGPEYAMKVVNECFDMNIQYYATVNFFGFQKIAEALGGIEVDITEAEMNEINNKQLDMYHIFKSQGEEGPSLETDLLKTYGPNTHLTGHQTLAYARIRKSDGTDSDFTRAERQRTVLIKLMQKLRGTSAMDLLLMVNSLSQYVTTNMDLNTVAEIAVNVLNSGFSNVETMRLPMNGTYKEEKRNEEAMLYDCDWKTNALELYNFIYE